MAAYFIIFHPNNKSDSILYLEKSFFYSNNRFTFPQYLSVSQTYNYLHLSEVKSIHLNNVVNLIAPSFKLIVYSEFKGRVVLKFDSMPRSYVMGHVEQEKKTVTFN